MTRSLNRIRSTGLENDEFSPLCHHPNHRNLRNLRIPLSSSRSANVSTVLVGSNIDHEYFVVGSNISILAVRCDDNIGQKIGHGDWRPYYLVSRGAGHHHLLESLSYDIEIHTIRRDRH